MFSLTLEPIYSTREVEEYHSEFSKKIQLAITPQGPIQRVASHQMGAYVIWKFAENIEGAKQFLIDYVGNFRRAFLASRFYLYPCYPNTVRDLNELIANDPKGIPPPKYKVLKDALRCTTNIGYPGYANAAIEEIFGMNVISGMFRKVAQGLVTPVDAIREAESECKGIFKKWKERGLV